MNVVKLWHRLLEVVVDASPLVIQGLHRAGHSQAGGAQCPKHISYHRHHPHVHLYLLVLLLLNL